MSTNKWLAVGLAVVASTVSSVAGNIGWTPSIQGPGGSSAQNELIQLMTLINYDTPPGLDYSTDGLTVSFEGDDGACVITYISRQEPVQGATYDFTNFSLFDTYDSVFAGVKSANSINWFQIFEADGTVTLSHHEKDSISHITYYGMICEDDDTPGEKVSDSGSVLALLGGGLLGLAGIRRRLNR